MEQFIELNRLFYSLPAAYSYGAKSDDIDIAEASNSSMGGSIHWEELLKEYRTVILAEAGAGKTQEIRHTALALRSEGKPAFFMRLEHVADGLEGAFEVGTNQEFQNWLNSNEEGWLFLDSVDEARLKDPKDFEKVIRKLSVHISVAIPRTHIIITSRVTAWRPKTDLKFCNMQLPFSQVEEKENEINIEVEVSSTTVDLSHEKISSLKKTKQENEGFKIYSLANLTRNQIVNFIEAKGIKESSRFLDEIERQDGWAFTTRPQDLDEIIEFWNYEKRIGTHFELMQHNIKRRLQERDQDRADSKPFTLEKAQKGVRLLASACIFMHESAIRVPDGTSNSKGIDVKSILTDWDDRECQILLSRPIFDEAIYGSVRFHHRSVREYLTAEWFSEELKNESSRQKIENLFFRIQYEKEVITPSMKPILAWLVLLDLKIMLKVYKLEPEIILEGGDPSKLPLETRRSLLTLVCQKIALRTSHSSIEERAAVQRFALSDMAADIIDLLKKYEKDKDVAYYLLNLR